MCCVIFDVDGTLVDSNDAHADAWVAAFAESGVHVDRAHVRRCIGMGGDKLMPQVSGITEDSARGQRIASRRAEIFREHHLPGVRGFPRVAELLARLAEDGVTLGVASSAKESELQPLLQAAGAAEFFSTTTSSDDADESKPDPDIVAAALKKARCTAGNAILVGDTPYDVEAALRAGVRPVAVRSGGWDEQGLSGAVAVFDSVSEMLDRYGEVEILLGLAPADQRQRSRGE
jgi:phosphoglycolate phosphatase-like HAD superfamily hydrolase